MTGPSLKDMDPATIVSYRHEFALTPQQVYEAFIQPQLLVGWFGPSQWQIIPASLTLEPVTGGRLQFVMRHSLNPKVQAPMYLRFVGMVEPSLLEFQEAIPTAQGQPSANLLALRLELTESAALGSTGADPGTVLSLQQGPLPKQVHKQTINSWRQSFQRLAQLYSA
ncbi:MAG: SRPBCC domain-containing protein [Rothia sp. (in: high G+C Gram-positive bacteria)]|nr:SRPBCC domain-containing protein [Rothia sp. (in: high G+C Gram-positive bacteria)]